MDIDQLAGSFKTLKELQAYCNSQYQVIAQLNKKTIQQQQEIEHLKTLLSKAAPIIEEGEEGLEIYKDMPNELIACLTQIKLLKDKAVLVELTYEEAKKLDIYTKLVVSLRQGSKKEKNPGEEAKSEDLLKLALVEDITNG